MSVADRSTEVHRTRCTPPGAGQLLAAVVRRGLADNRRAPLTWGGALGALGILIVAIWPSIEDTIGEAVDAYPEGLKEAFGIERLDSVELYLDAELFSFLVPFAVVFLVARLVLRPTVGAEDRGHLDTLLSLPLPRRVLVLGSYLVAGIVAAAVLAVTWLVTWVAGTIAGTGVSAGVLAAGVVNVWPLAMAFAGLTVLAVGLSHRTPVITAVVASALVGMYVLDIIGRLSDPVEPFRAASAFRYYGSAIQDGLDPVGITVLLFAGALLALAGAERFERRDIR